MKERRDLCDLQLNPEGAQVLPPVGLRTGGFAGTGVKFEALNGSARLC